MISEDNKRLAQWAMDYALKNGCQQARVTLSKGVSNSIGLRDGKTEQLQQNASNSLSITLYVDGRYGRYETNRLEKKELERFISNGIEATRYLAKDEARTLPDASRYYKGGSADLQLCDNRFNKIDPDTKLEMAQAVAQQILGKNPRIISVSSNYSDGNSAYYTITSNGFEGETLNTYYGLSCSTSIKGEGEARPSAGWSESSILFNELPTAGIGDEALRRALAKIGQKKIQSGKYTMIIEPRSTGQLLGPLFSAIQGEALQQKTSFLIDQLDKQVASNKFTIMDQPHLVGARGARYFDGEGAATKEQPIFENGVLKNYYINTYVANKMNTVPTLTSPSVAVMALGNKDLNAIVADVDRAILVTGFNGGNCNSTTGNFSYGVEGFLVENGQLTQPISEMNITGNMLSLWASLVETGNDPNLRSSYRIPTLVFEDVNFSGL